MTIDTNFKYRKGDIFNSKDQTLVNTVNTVGVMGKGLALEFKKRYSDMFEQYKKLCESKDLTMGKLFLYQKTVPWILNFPTKVHWRSKSKLEYIEKGLREFVEQYSDWGVESISFPQLGCQNGGLDWSDVKPIMEKYLTNLKIPVTIYLYSKTKLEDYFEEKVLDLPSRWKSTRNRTGYYFSEGKIHIFWDRGSDDVKVKIGKMGGGWELVSSIKLDSSLITSIKNSIEKLQSRELLLDEIECKKFRDNLSRDLKIIRNQSTKSSESIELEDLINEINPIDFIDVIKKLHLEQDYHEMKKTLVDAAVKKILDFNNLHKEATQYTDSQKLMLRLLVQNNGIMEYMNLKKLFTKHKSTSTFCKTIIALKENFLIFEILKEDDTNIIAMPNGFQEDLKRLL